MWCKTCGYVLDGLGEYRCPSCGHEDFYPELPTWCVKCGYIHQGAGHLRCPECGGAFDPNQRRTYRSSPPLPAWRKPVTLGAIIILVGLVPGLVVFWETIWGSAPPDQVCVIEGMRLIELRFSVDQAIDADPSTQFAAEMMKKVALGYTGAELSMFQKEFEAHWEKIEDDPAVHVDVKKLCQHAIEKIRGLPTTWKPTPSPAAPSPTGGTPKSGP
jgi:hypothetical protein